MIKNRLMVFFLPQYFLFVFIFFTSFTDMASVFPAEFDSNTGGWSIYANDDSVFTSSDKNYLPSGPTTVSILEYWYLPSVVSNVTNGGFASTESLIVNMHGSSIFWQRYWLNGVDITDPAHPGKTLIDFPLNSWDIFFIRSLAHNYNDQNGYNWNIYPEAEYKDCCKLKLSIVNNLGGPSFIVKNTLDREPAQDWGAPEERRRFSTSLEADASSYFHGIADQPGYFFVQLINHNKKFISLDNTENNFLITTVLAHRINQKMSLLTAYQVKDRENEGAEYGLSEEKTFHLHTQHLLSILTHDEKKWNYTATFGFGYDLQRDREETISLDIKDEVIYGPLQTPSEDIQFFLDGKMSYPAFWIFKDFMNTSIGFSGNFRFAFIQKKEGFSQNFLQRTDEGSPLDVLIHETPLDSYDILTHYRGNVFTNSTINQFGIETELGFLSDVTFDQDQIPTLEDQPCS